MNDSKQTAKEIQKDLKKYHYALNHGEVLPEQWVRMSHPDHALVCWVNTLIGLYNSKNYEPIPLFLSRVIERIDRASNRPVGGAYLKIADLYCCQLAYYLMNYTNVDSQAVTHLLPQRLLFCGVTYFPSGQYPEPSNHKTS